MHLSVESAVPRSNETLSSDHNDLGLSLGLNLPAGVIAVIGSVGCSVDPAGSDRMVLETRLPHPTLELVFKKFSVKGLRS